MTIFLSFDVDHYFATGMIYFEYLSSLLWHLKPLAVLIHMYLDDEILRTLPFLVLNQKNAMDIMCVFYLVLYLSNLISSLNCNHLFQNVKAFSNFAFIWNSNTTTNVCIMQISYETKFFFFQTR